MSGHLDRLAARAVGVLPVLTPLPRPLFAADPDVAPEETAAEHEVPRTSTLASLLLDTPPPPARWRGLAEAVTPAAPRREAPEPLRPKLSASAVREPAEMGRADQPGPAVHVADGEARSEPSPAQAPDAAAPLRVTTERVAVAAEAPTTPHPAPSERLGEPAARPSPPVRRSPAQRPGERPVAQVRTTSPPPGRANAAPTAPALADVAVPHVVAVTIGRIDVTALAPPPRPVRAVAPVAGVGPALEGYLADMDAR